MWTFNNSIGYRKILDEFFEVKVIWNTGKETQGPLITFSNVTRSPLLPPKDIFSSSTSPSGFGKLASPIILRISKLCPRYFMPMPPN